MTRTKRFAILSTITTLIERWPVTFFEPVRRVPIKIGIDVDIKTAAPEIDNRTLQLALRYYCHSISYLRAQATGASRVDLNGAAAGTVSDKEAATAAAWLADFTKRDQARKKAKAATVPKPALSISLAGLREAARRRRLGGVS